MSPVSRRQLLGVSGTAAAAGVAAYAVGRASQVQADAASVTSADAGPALALDAPIPFHGEHQAGIVTPAQDRLHFVALDVVTRELAQLRQLIKKLTRAA